MKFMSGYIASLCCFKTSSDVVSGYLYNTPVAALDDFVVVVVDF
jgi:hypothetical protein